MSDVVSGMEPEGVPRLFVQSCVAPCSRNRRLLIVIHTRAVVGSRPRNRGVHGEHGCRINKSAARLYIFGVTMHVAYAVTFEFETRPPLTHRGTVAGTSTATCVARAVRTAQRALHPVAWSTMNCVLLERLEAHEAVRPSGVASDVPQGENRGAGAAVPLPTSDPRLEVAHTSPRARLQRPSGEAAQPPSHPLRSVNPSS